MLNLEKEQYDYLSASEEDKALEEMFEDFRLSLSEEEDRDFDNDDDEEDDDEDEDYDLDDDDEVDEPRYFGDIEKFKLWETRMESSKKIIVNVDLLSEQEGGKVTIIIPPTVPNDIGQDVSGELMSDLKTVFEKYDRQAADFIYQSFKQRRPRGEFYNDKLTNPNIS